MSTQDLQQELADAQSTAQALREELAQTHRGLLALTMELEERVDERTAELRRANRKLKAEIAERKQAEEALRKAGQELIRSNAELEQKVEERTARLREMLDQMEAFSYTLSHDLRAPLRAVSTFTGFVLERQRELLGSEGSGFLEKSLAATRRMDQLITDVLGLTRIARSEFTAEPVDIEKLLDQILQERPEFQTPKAQITIQRPLHPVLGDRASLTQCLTNLLGNAVKYVRASLGPEVRVWTETFWKRESDARVDAENMRASHGQSIQEADPPAAPEIRWVRLWVEDNGIGIPPEAHKKIFELFQRLHTQNEYEGTGIGLAIVRKAVERMGGRVGVESQPGQGSRFWLELREATTAHAV